jgi:hypothetical protein
MPSLVDANRDMTGIQGRPSRMYMADIDTQETLEMQFNPAELEEVLEPVWAKLEVPGLSHERLQYSHTRNHTMSFELIFDAMIGGPTTTDQNMDARKFLLSLCYAKKGAQNVNDGQATRVLFVWPTFVSLTAKIGTIKISHTRFNLNGTPTFFKARVSIEEIRDTRLYSEDVRESGTLRQSTDVEDI